MGFPGGSDGKESALDAGDQCSIPGSGRSPGEENDNPLQYSCLKNSMDGGAWWATVQGVTKSLSQLSNYRYSYYIFLSRFGKPGLYCCTQTMEQKNGQTDLQCIERWHRSCHMGHSEPHVHDAAALDLSWVILCEFP